MSEAPYPPIAQSLPEARARRDALWRAAWKAGARRELERANAAGAGLKSADALHWGADSAWERGARGAAGLALSVGLGLLSLPLAPIIVLKKGRLPWFSASLARAASLSGEGGSRLGVLVDAQNPQRPRLLIGAAQSALQEALISMSQEGLTQGQALEALVGHELGHAASAMWMRDARLGALMSAEMRKMGVSEALAQAASKARDMSLPLAALGSGMSMACFSALALCGHPFYGFALGMGAARLASAWEPRMPKSGAIWEEGFADAFAILLPLAQRAPDRALALARLEAFEGYRAEGQPGLSHSVSDAAGSLRRAIESGELDGLEREELARQCSKAGALCCAAAMSLARSERSDDLVANRQALSREAEAHLAPREELPEEVARSAARAVERRKQALGVQARARAGLGALRNGQ